MNIFQRFVNVIDRLGEFHHIYNSDTLGDKYELIRFWGQKVKGQGQNLAKRGQKGSPWEALSKLFPSFLAK